MACFDDFVPNPVMHRFMHSLMDPVKPTVTANGHSDIGWKLLRTEPRSPQSGDRHLYLLRQISLISEPVP